MNNTALVTGASRGIGNSITKKLLKEGFSVIGTTRKTPFDEQILSLENFEVIQVDLADQSKVEEGLKPIFEQETSFGVLINNAGVFEEADFQEDDKTWLQTWDKTQQVNLKMPALLSKWAINSWVKKEEGGIIINIASRAAYRGDTQEYAAYSASKAGLVAFTKSIARDFAKQHIYAYSIAPGFTKTDMAMESIKTYGEEYLTEGMAFDKMTSPDEVAELIAFIAAGNVPHMTGQTFHINGGSYFV